MIHRIALIASLALSSVACGGAQTPGAIGLREVVQGPHVPSGTSFTLQLIRPVGATTGESTQPFQAFAIDAVRTDMGEVFVPAGAVVRGELAWSEARQLMTIDLGTIETVVGTVQLHAAIRSGALPAENTTATAPSNVGYGFARSGPETREPLARAGLQDSAAAPLSRHFRLPTGAEVQLILIRPLLAPGTSVVQVH